MVTLPERKPSSRVMRSALAIDSSASTGNTVRLLWVIGEPNRHSGRTGALRFDATAGTLRFDATPPDFASTILPDDEQASENAHKTSPASTLIGAFMGVLLLVWIENVGWRIDLTLERSARLRLARFWRD